MKEEFLAQIDEYMVYVYNIALKMLGEEDAKDAAQESIIKAYEKMDQFRGECALSTWLYRITINECKDILRRKKEYIPLEEIAKIDSGALTEFDIEQIEARDLISRAFTHMNPSDREILILREFLGYDYAEIAHELSVPLGTVKSGINRAKKKMKRVILSLYGGKKYE